MDEQKQKYTFKSWCTVDGDKSKCKVKLTPEPETYDDVLTHIGLIMSSVPVTLLRLSLMLPILREATDEELSVGTYIFADESDSHLYKVRKQLYDSLKSVFIDALDQAFVDVLYVDSCKRQYEELAFDKSEEELEEYKKDIEAVRASVLKALNKTEEDVQEEVLQEEQPVELYKEMIN